MQVPVTARTETVLDDRVVMTPFLGHFQAFDFSSPLRVDFRVPVGLLSQASVRSVAFA